MTLIVKFKKPSRHISLITSIDLYVLTTHFKLYYRLYNKQLAKLIKDCFGSFTTYDLPIFGPV